MRENPSITIDDHLPPALLPTLTNRITGVVGEWRDELGRIRYDMQCQRCAAIESASPWQLTRTLFYRCLREQDLGPYCEDCHDRAHVEGVDCG